MSNPHMCNKGQILLCLTDQQIVVLVHQSYLCEDVLDLCRCES